MRHLIRSAPGRGRARKALVAAAATATLIGGIGAASLVVASPAGASPLPAHNFWGFGGWQSGSSSSSSTSSDCPVSANGDVAFTGTVSDGSATFGSAATASGLAGSLCGLVDLSNLQATVQSSNFTFSPTSIKLYNFLSLPTTISVVGASTATLTEATDGDFTTSMTVPLQATVNLLGLFSCTVGPFSPTLTTGRSGSVSGTPLTGSILTSLSGTLAAGEFSVPAIQASSSCPGIIAGLANLIMGLPLASGRSTITTNVSLTPVLSASS